MKTKLTAAQRQALLLIAAAQNGAIRGTIATSIRESVHAALDETLRDEPPPRAGRVALGVVS